MVDPNEEKMTDLLGINVNRLDAGGCLRLIAELLDMLTTPDLRRVRDLAEEKRRQRLRRAERWCLRKSKRS